MNHVHDNWSNSPKKCDLPIRSQPKLSIQNFTQQRALWLRKTLDQLRNGVGLYQASINLTIRDIRHGVQSGQFSFDDIGTNAAELHSFADEKSLAIRRLIALRNSTCKAEYDFRYITFLRQFASTKGNSVTDIDTSEEELKALHSKGYMFIACEALDSLRKDSSKYGYLINQIRIQCQKGSFSLVDIGTDEEELKRIRLLGFKIDSCETIHCLRNENSSVYCRFNSHRYYTARKLFRPRILAIRRKVYNGEISLAEIGTNEEELASFEKNLL